MQKNKPKLRLIITNQKKISRRVPQILLIGSWIILIFVLTGMLMAVSGCVINTMKVIRAERPLVMKNGNPCPLLWTAPYKDFYEEFYGDGCDVYIRYHKEVLR